MRVWIASDRVREVRSALFQVYVLVALLFFAALALLASTFPIFQPDVFITLDLQRTVPHWFGLVLEAVSVPGYTIESISIVAVITAYLAIIGLRWEAIATLFAAVSDFVVNYLVKIVVHRPRPSANLVNVFIHLKDYSFPSGHVMFYTAFFGFLLFLTYTLLKRSFPRYLIMTLLALLIVLIGFSRIYLGEHWSSDVIGGYLGGSLVLALTVAFYRWGKESRVVSQPVAVTGGDHGPLPPEEKQEVKEALQNPLLPKKEAEKVKAQEEKDDNNSNGA